MSTYGVGVKPALPSLHERQVPPAAEKDAGSDGGAWQREMERAQMLAWLSHSAIGHTAAVLGAGAISPATASTGPLAAAAQSCKTPLAAGSAGSATLAPALPKAPPVSAPGLGADTGHTFLAQGSHRAAVAGEQIASGSRQRTVPPISAAPVAGNIDSQATGMFAGTLGAEKTLADGPDALQLTTPLQEGALPLSAEPQALSAGPRSGPVSSIRRDMAEFMAVLRGFGPHVTMSGDMRAAHAAAKSGPLALMPPAGLSTGAAADPASGQPWIREDPVTAVPSQAGDRRPQATQLTSRSQNAAARAMAGSPAEPVRVHAEWSKEGVRLYLGIDASALGSLQAVTLQLQAWLSAQGFRLRSISCNGRVITQEPPTADTFQSELPSAELPRFPTARSTPKEFP